MGDPLTVEELLLDAAPGRRGAGARGGCRRLPLRPAPGRRPPGRRERQPIVLGHEGAGVVEAIGAGVHACRVPVTAVGVLLRPRLRRLRAVPGRAARTCATTAGAHNAGRRAGRMAPPGCGFRTAARSSTSSAWPASPSGAWCRAASAVPRARRTCRCGRRRWSAAASSPASVPCATPPASRVGDTVAVIGCGGVGVQAVSGGGDWPAPGGSSRSTAIRRSSSWPAAHGATDACPGRRPDAVPTVRAADRRRRRPCLRGCRPCRRRSARRSR